MIWTKTCSKCEATKLVEDFARDSANIDERQRWCKDCMKGYKKDHNRPPDRELLRQQLIARLQVNHPSPTQAVKIKTLAQDLRATYHIIQAELADLSFKYPIGSCAKGMFWMSDQDGVDVAVRYLDQRAVKIFQRKALRQKTYDSFKNQGELF